MKLLYKNDKDIVNYAWKVIFNSSNDDFVNFREKVFDKKNILLLIELKGECVIGGYTKRGWESSEYYEENDLNDGEEVWHADKDVFVFYLKSPQNHESFISNLKQDDESISHGVGYTSNSFGNLGDCWPFFIFEWDKKGVEFESQENTEENNFEKFQHGSQWLTGSIQYQTVEGNQMKIEAFQIQC